MILARELVVDFFAGGGGASFGIECALGRSPDIAVNHDREAIALHAANHPDSRHYQEDVWKVDPIEATGGRPVVLFWASPDCTHHSKACGGKPRSKKIRGLAWVVVRWAKAVQPRVIALENVEEFEGWGPLLPDDHPNPKLRGRPDPAKAGRTFRLFCNRLRGLGYEVQHRILRASEFGAPTSRKRLFVIARRDGRPIVWPKRTHGKGTARPERAFSECADWSVPVPSIFTRKKPLAENTQRRIARGLKRFVLDTARPFIVSYHSAKRSGDDRIVDIDGPLPTQDTSNRYGLVAPYLVPRYGEREGQAPRTLPVTVPLPTVVPTQNGAQLVAAFIARHFTGVEGSTLFNPLPTITAIDHHSLVTATLEADRSEQVRAFLVAYFGNEKDGGSLFDPLRTITGRDRFGLVTVHGHDYYIADIGLRMLTPRELYRAQGFPDSYKIEIPYTDARGKTKPLPKTAQVRMCGNSVCPPLAEAIVRANLYGLDAEAAA